MSDFDDYGDDDATSIDDPLNRRSGPRIERELQVEYTSLDDFVVAYTEDISRGGLFVRTANLLPIGSAVRIDLVLPGKDSRFGVIARVAYLRDGAKAQATGRDTGMGMEFLDADAGNLLRELEAYITLNVAEQATPAAPAKADILLVGNNMNGWLAPLEANGHKILRAATGMEALGLILTQRLDLVLASAELPMMDGWQLLTLVRQRPTVGYLPFALVTDEPMSNEQRLRAYQLGVDDIIRQSVSDAEVDIRVNRIVSRARKDAGSSASRSALRGSIQELSLASLLSFVEVERRTGELLVVAPSAMATLYIREGQVIDVEVAGAEGVEADGVNLLYQVLNWPAGRFELNTCDVNRATVIDVRTSFAILEHARLTDESNQ